MNVTEEKIFEVIGRKQVEIEMLRAEVLRLESRVRELEPQEESED